MAVGCTGRNAVLVVEDDDDVRGALVALLECEGYNVLEAADGAAGLDRLRGGGVCLVLLDLWMPRMNGLEFRVAQQKDRAMAGVPVVIVTADQAGAKRAADLGVEGCIRKPVDFPELLGWVGRYC